MTLEDATELLEPAVPASGVWADLGAGTGLVTRALASLLGAGGRVIAVERDDEALAALQEVARRRPEDAAEIVAVAGDVRRLEAVRALDGLRLDGILLANVLHYVAKPAPALADLAARLGDGGRIVVVEYERREANPWVPYPLPLDRLGAAAEEASLAAPRVVATRPSRFGGSLYCAVLEPA